MHTRIIGAVTSPSRRRLERALGVPDAVDDPSTRREAAATAVLDAPGLDTDPGDRRPLKIGVAEGCVDFMVRAQGEGWTDGFLARLEPLDEAAARLAKLVETSDVLSLPAERTDGRGVDVLDVPMSLLTGLIREMLSRRLEHVREHPLESVQDPSAGGP